MIGRWQRTFGAGFELVGAVATDVALRLSRAFDTTPELWLNLQRNYDLSHTANETTDWQAIRPILEIAHVSA